MHSWPHAAPCLLSFFKKLQTGDFWRYPFNDFQRLDFQFKTRTTIIVLLGSFPLIYEHHIRRLSLLTLTGSNNPNKRGYRVSILYLFIYNKCGHPKCPQNRWNCWYPTTGQLKKVDVSTLLCEKIDQATDKELRLLHHILWKTILISIITINNLDFRLLWKINYSYMT